MKKTTQNPIGNIADIPLDAVIQEWRRQRYALFRHLKDDKRMTMEQIGERCGITRQAVGQFMRSMHSADN